MHPSCIVAPIYSNARFCTSLQVPLVNLITREYQAFDPYTQSARGADSRVQISPKRVDILPIFETIVMREGMRADFLAGGRRDCLDK